MRVTISKSLVIWEGWRKKRLRILQDLDWNEDDSIVPALFLDMMGVRSRAWETIERTLYSLGERLAVLDASIGQFMDQEQAL